MFFYLVGERRGGMIVPFVWMDGCGWNLVRLPPLLA
jgi:hypothetical protein